MNFSVKLGNKAEDIHMEVQLEEIPFGYAEDKTKYYKVLGVNPKNPNKRGDRKLIGSW